MGRFQTAQEVHISIGLDNPEVPGGLSQRCTARRLDENVVGPVRETLELRPASRPGRIGADGGIAGSLIAA